jgi:tRNA (cytosine38-C5)-methyltransferase
MAQFQTTETFNQFLQAPDGSQSVDILRPLGLRYFSPTELLRIFDFIPRHSRLNFHWTEGISTKTKYRLIGNSVNVTVVKELLQYLFDE